MSMVQYDDSALRAIVRCVGTPVKIDSNTALATRANFARVCIQIDLAKPLRQY